MEVCVTTRGRKERRLVKVWKCAYQPGGGRKGRTTTLYPPPEGAIRLHHTRMRYAPSPLRAPPPLT